jgi:hypothetical protein
MPKISQLSGDTTPVITDYVAGNQASSPATRSFKLSDLITLFFNNIPLLSVKRTSIDWSTFANNIKSATNTATGSYSAGDNSFASICSISFTMGAAGYALVTSNISATTSSDFEEHPEIYLDGSLYHSYAPAAALESTNIRGVVRSTTWLVPLSAGTHTLAPGAYFAAGSGTFSFAAGSVEISALVLGNVTA